LQADRLLFSGSAALALLAVAAQVPIFDRNFVSMDEGHLALTASRLLAGDVLYRDIHTGIFPGIYAIAAGLFALFGEELLVTRIAQIFVNATSVVLLWRIGARIMPISWALLPPVLYVTLVWISFPVLTMFNYSALAGTLGLAALLAAIRFLDRGRGVDAIAIGLLVGCCLFTKQNYGGLAAAAIAGAILLAKPRSALRDTPVVVAFAPIVVSGATFLALSIGWLAATGTLSAWVDSTLLSLVGSQLQDFDNPIPPIFGAHPANDPRFVYLYIPSSLFDLLLSGDRFVGLRLDPWFVSALIRLFYGVTLFALIAAPARLAWTTPRSGEASDDHGATIAVVVFAVAFFFGIFPSAVFSHLAYVMAPMLLLFAWLGDTLAGVLAKRSRGLERVWLAVAAALVAGIVAACATIPGHVRSTYSTPSGLPHVSIYVTPGQAQIHAEAMRFVSECARPGEAIFTLPILPVLYLASGRPNPVKWDLLIPGAIDQAAIIETLEQERIRCVVRQRDMNPEFPPLPNLYPDLDGYIEHNYRKGRALEGGGQLWRGLRRTTPFSDSALSGSALSGSAYRSRSAAAGVAR
jgi:hypothetical protein